MSGDDWMSRVAREVDEAYERHLEQYRVESEAEPETVQETWSVVEVRDE